MDSGEAKAIDIHDRRTSIKADCKEKCLHLIEVLSGPSSGSVLSTFW
jgi:hypothetical protein